MKIGGVDPKTLCNEVLLVLPRGDVELVFRARGLKDMDKFNDLCPQPKMPTKLTREGPVSMPEDVYYKEMIDQWAKKRLGYIVVNSLEPSDIEWDTVEEDNPRTWKNWENDLRNGGLSEIECSRVLATVMEANALDEAKLRKAREVFLRGQVQTPPTSSGQVTEPASMPSGAPAKG